MATNNLMYKELSSDILASAFCVYNTLGYGFLEKVYENALCLKLRQKGIDYSQQHAISVIFENVVVGDYYADIFVDGKIIIELKVAETVTGIHKAQLINYLVATGCDVGIILCFGSNKVDYARVTRRL